MFNSLASCSLTSTMRVSLNTVVAFRFIMLDDLGNVLQDTSQSSPVRYVHGSSSIDKLLQSQVEGLAPGDIAEISVADKTGNYKLRVVIDSIRPALQNEVSSGYPVEPGECGNDCNCHEN